MRISENTCIKTTLDSILEISSGQTDVLFSQDFTSRADKYLQNLSDEDSEKVLELLNDEHGLYPYFHETHDFSKQPFDEEGYCRHGLTWFTCPAGCGELSNHR